MTISSLLLGAVGYGRSGIGGIVTKIDTDRIVLKFADGIIKRVPIDAIERWEFPAATAKPLNFELGDRVRYIGSNFYLKSIYGGELKIWNISPLDGCTCLKPDGRLSSWISFSDLISLDSEIPSDERVHQDTTEGTTRFKSGDKVRYVGEDATLFGVSDREILDVVEDCGEWIKVRTFDKKPISIPQLDLELLELTGD